jgi:hypothetical protein
MTRALFLPGYLLAEAAARSIASAHGEIRGAVARLGHRHVHATVTICAAALVAIAVATTPATTWPFAIGYVAFASILVLCDHAWRCVPTTPLALFAGAGALFALTHLPFEPVLFNLGLNAGAITMIALAVNLLFRELRFRRTGRRPPRRTAMSGIATGDIYLVAATALWLPADAAAVFWMSACLTTLACALVLRTHTIRGAFAILAAGYVAIILGPDCDSYLTQPIAAILGAVLA